jgi:hypothetical protein
MVIIMKISTLGNLFVVSACVAALGLGSIAAAQSVKHDHLDARAARADIARLQKDRRRAVRFHNLAKVAQDDRLIASDRFWIRRDQHKIKAHS